MKSPTRSESYQLSEKLKKCNLFLKYQLRQFNWWFQDIAEGSKDAFASEINDIEIMKSVGFSATPSDGIIQLQKISNYVCKFKGGDGAFREFADVIISSRK